MCFCTCKRKLFFFSAFSVYPLALFLSLQLHSLLITFLHNRNFMQRQTVYFGAKLDEKLWQLGSLKSDERRYSLPRITSSGRLTMQEPLLQVYHLSLIFIYHWSGHISIVSTVRYTSGKRFNPTFQQGLTNGFIVNFLRKEEMFHTCCKNNPKTIQKQCKY